MRALLSMLPVVPVLWVLQATQPPARAGRPAVVRPSSARTSVAVAEPGTILVAAPGTAERTLLLNAQVESGIAREYARADQLAAALGGTVVDDAPGRWRLRIGGATLVLRDGLPFAVAGEGDAARELPLASAPFVEGERLWVPLQLASDLLPRLVPEVAYDPSRRALTLSRRRARTVAPVASRPAVPAPAARAPDAAVASAPSVARDSAAETVRLPSIVGARGEVDVRTDSGAPAPRGGPTMRTVVVDAGHGGPDGGMSGPLGGGPQIAEKRVTLAVALALRSALRARGVGVVMTRTTDTLIALSDRGRIANQKGGDLFISIHVNAANPSWRDPGAMRGFETYILSEAKTEDDRRVADLENRSVRFEAASSSGRDDPLGFIMRDMAQNEHLRESSTFASLVEQRLRRVHPGPSRGVKQAGFRVLVSAFMPSALVEIGFGSNAAESAYISSAAGQRAIAEAVAEAAVEYLRRYEQRVRTGARP